MYRLCVGYVSVMYRLCDGGEKEQVGLAGAVKVICGKTRMKNLQI